MAAAHSAEAIPTTSYENGFTFSYENSKGATFATITDYDGPGGAVTIPSAYGVHPVRVLGVNAFVGGGITSVNIPDSVTRIGTQSFWGNPLTSATIPNSVTTIDSGAFFMTKISSIMIPNSVTSIGQDAFAVNYAESLTIGSSVTTIDPGAFATNRLRSVTIPNSVVTIGDSAFTQNILTSVIIGSSVMTIGARAFFSNSMASVTIPASVASIGANAFVSNSTLTSVLMMGSAPSVTPASAAEPTFGATDPMVYFRQGASGFTLDGAGKWQGYRAMALGLKVPSEQRTANQGGTLSISGTGAFPGSTITAAFGNGPAIGTGKAGGTGSFTVSARIPADTPVGPNSIKLTGPFATTTMTLQVPITVEEGTADPGTADPGMTKPGTEPGTPKPTAPKPGTCRSKPFTDVAASRAACSSIAWLKKAKATSGKKFHPTKKLTRIDAAQMLYRITSGGSAAPVCNAKALARFTDTKSQATCRYATWAAGAGLIAPATAKTFKPNAQITRAQLATALYQLRSSAKAQKCTPKKFSDVTAGNSACRAISWVVKTKVMPKADGKKFKPSAKITRQQAAVILAAAAPRIT